MPVLTDEEFGVAAEPKFLSDDEFGVSPKSLLSDSEFGVDEPSLHESLTSDLSSGDPSRIAKAMLPLIGVSNQALDAGLSQAEKMQTEKQTALPSPVEALRQDPRYYKKPPGMLETAFGAVGEAAAAALNIPQAMVRSATGVTPKQFKIATDASGKEQLTQEEVPLHFQPGKPAIEFRRTEMQPEGNAIGRLIEGFLTPENIALFPFAGSKVVQAAFLAQTAPAAIEAATKLVSPETPPDQRHDAATELLINGLMSAGIASHLVKSEAPITAAEVSKETPEPIKSEVAPESLTPATDAATASQKPKVGEPALEQTPIPSEGTSPEAGVPDKTIPLVAESKAEPNGVVRVTYRDAEGNEVGYGQLDGKVINMVSVKEPFQKKGYGAQIIKDLRDRGGLYGVAGTKEGLALMRSKSVAAREYEPNTFTFEPDTPAETSPSEAKGNIASDWTSATEETPTISETPKPTGTSESSGEFTRPETHELYAGVPIPKFNNRKMSPLDKVTAQHSGKIQKSMSEARRAQKEIKKSVPSDRRQAAISIWREANGDVPTLQAWASAAKGKDFKRAATDAQNLTPAEIVIARKAIAAFDVLERRGNTFDVLKSHRDNYIPHVWDIKKPGTGFGTGMLKQRFKFSKARTFNTFFDGDQAGFKPKTLAIGKLLPAYIHEMNTVIADRQFVRDMIAHDAKDGKPLAVPRGSAKAVDGSQGKAVLVQPKTMREPDTSEYRVMSDQPALSGWTWEGKDTDGKPVFVKADLALHPEAYRRIHAMMGQSAIRTWYRDPVGGTAQIPRAIVRGIDTAQSAMKREMFGLLAPFHQVQEGTHAIGHTVNPVALSKGGFSHRLVSKIIHINPMFELERIDLSKSPAQLDAANHGLMLLPDRASSQVYLEGVGTKSSLLSRGIRKIPKAGEAVANVIDGYQDYLFHQYIPALKFKTYEAMVRRNTKLYADELASGEMTLADVKITSAEQANAAYGHLNYALLDRNPTIQHVIQLAALAPDFLEARARFAGQGVKGLSSKVGHEQLRALALLAATQAGAAVVLSILLGTPYDPKHPFEVIYRGRRYAMRSVPEDIYSLLKDTRQFIYSRVNPLTVKGGIQLATGLNYRGEKVTALDTMEELLAGYIPITARSIPGLRSLTETGRNSPTSPLQQLSGSLGLRISRYSPISETYKLASDWKDAQKLPKDSGSYPVSKYQQLRYALEDGDLERARTEYDNLAKTMPPFKIASGFAESINHPFTGSKSNDAKFRESLKGYDREMFDLAVRTRANILKAYKQMPPSKK